MIININDCGGIGDGINDDTPYVMAALAKCSEKGGGTIKANGLHRITSQVGLALNPGPAFPKGAYQQIEFVGDGSGTGFVVNAPSAQALFSFYGLYVQFRDLQFVPFNTANDGTADVNGPVIAFGSCFDSRVDNCWFNGVRSASSMITNSDSDVTIRGNAFTGCSAAAAGLRGLIAAILYSDMVVEYNRFEAARIERGRSIGKVTGLPNAPWLYFNGPGSGSAHDIVGAVNASTTIVRKNKFCSISVHPCVMFAAPALPLDQPDLLFDRILVEDNNFDQWATSALIINNARYVKIARNWFGTGTAQANAIELHNAGHVITEMNNAAIGLGGTAGPTDIFADALTKSLVSIDDNFLNYNIADLVATPTFIERAGVRTQKTA